jgi:hypothetical protein
MNIAIQDAAELAAGFRERFGEANDSCRLGPDGPVTLHEPLGVTVSGTCARRFFGDVRFGLTSVGG